MTFKILSLDWLEISNQSLNLGQNDQQKLFKIHKNSIKEILVKNAENKEKKKNYFLHCF